MISGINMGLTVNVRVSKIRVASTNRLRIEVDRFDTSGSSLNFEIKIHFEMKSPLDQQSASPSLTAVHKFEESDLNDYRLSLR